MKIGERSPREHLSLLAPLFAFLAAVWALRLVLYAAGAPLAVVRVCSVTVAGALSILFVALLIHVRQFGGYTNVVAVAFLLQCWQQLLIVAAIAFTAFTNIPNVYSAPEYSFAQSHLRHIVGHLTFGVAFGTLFGSAMGSLLLWMLRRVAPQHDKLNPT